MARSDLYIHSLKKEWEAENWRRVRELALEWEEFNREETTRPIVFPVRRGETVITVVPSSINLIANIPLNVYSGRDYPVSWRLINSQGEDISDGVHLSWQGFNMVLESNQNLSGLRLFVQTTPEG